MNQIAYIFLSVIAVSLLAILAAVPFILKKKIAKNTLVLLLSFSVGTLLGSVFIHFLPEAVSHGYTLGIAINIMAGFLLFFILDKFIHAHHEKKMEHHPGHAHGYSLAWVNMIGEAVHNFIDGLVIAGSYLVSIPLGIAATISIIFHEIPQEIADMGVLLYGGFSKTKAVMINFYTAITAILGAAIGILLANNINGFSEFIIPFTAGNFIYIAASNLLPEVHRHAKSWEILLHSLIIAAGVAIMAAVALLGPGHVH